MSHSSNKAIRNAGVTVSIFGRTALISCRDLHLQVPGTEKHKLNKSYKEYKKYYFKNEI